jgi:hypothetical protein
VQSSSLCKKANLHLNFDLEIDQSIMTFSDFSLSSVKQKFQLKLIEKADLFDDRSELQLSSLLNEILKENLSLTLASNTEKSRSEMLIAPILIDLRRQFSERIGIFSGVNFTVDISQGLNGNCDFLISYSDELLLITAPIVTLVEAKKEDLNGGLGQCIAEIDRSQCMDRSHRILSRQFAKKVCSVSTDC